MALIAVAFHWIGSVSSSMQRWWELAVVGATMGLGAMLLVQLPRALQWRPRLSPRPSTEVLAERRRIAAELPMAKLEAMIHPATLADLPALGAAILQGQVQGRVVVDVNA